MPTIAIAYPFYVKRVPHLRPSTSLHAILGSHGKDSIVGRLVDLAAMIALLGGAGTSLGVIAPTIAASIAELLGFGTSFTLEFVVMIACISLFGGSVYLGLDKGIRRLSDLNVYLMLGLLAFILVAGPTLFILKTSVNTTGFMLQNFVRSARCTARDGRTTRITMRLLHPGFRHVPVRHVSYAKWPRSLTTGN